MEENKKNSFIKEWLPYILIIIVVILIKQFIVTPIRVNGDSMNPTLYDGDIMILNRIGYKLNGLKRFDIVVVKKEKEYLIKRVVGFPGEEIEYKNNKLYVNGKLIKDKYGKKSTKDFKTKIPKGKYFVMGDNRDNSLDSRYLGAFKKKEILGKTNFTLFPFNRFGKKK